MKTLSNKELAVTALAALAAITALGFGAIIARPSLDSAERAECQRLAETYPSDPQVRAQVGRSGGEIREKCEKQFNERIPSG